MMSLPCEHMVYTFRIDTTTNMFLHPRGRAFLRTRRKPVDKQASGPHTNTLGREIKSPIQMTDIELMTYT